MRTWQKATITVIASVTIGVGGAYAGVHLTTGTHAAVVAPNPMPTPSLPSPPTYPADGYIKHLPGYGQMVSQADADLFRKSLVKIVWRTTGTNELHDWQPNCSGLKISIAGAVYVLTARHCFAQHVDTEKIYLDISGADVVTPKTVPPAFTPHQELHALQGAEYGVTTADTLGVYDSRHTARLRSIVLLYYPDVVLLRLRPNAYVDAIPAYPYTVGGRPKPGAEVVQASLPQSAGGSRVTSTGWYFGTAADNDPNQPESKVAINPANVSADACYYGASGSVGLIAGGFLTGPLGHRDNDVFPDGDEEGTALADRRMNRTYLEDMMHLSHGTLHHYSTICGYAVITPAQLRSLVLTK